MNGTDESINLLRCNVAMHAFMHKLLYEQHGHWKDKVAWLALSGHIGKDEAQKIARQQGYQASKQYNVERKEF